MLRCVKGCGYYHRIQKRERLISVPVPLRIPIRSGIVRRTMFGIKQLIIVGFLLLPVAAAAQSTSAKESLTVFLEAYREVALLWDDLTPKERRERMAPLIETAVADDMMLKFALGSGSRGLTRAQRNRLEAAFRFFLQDRIGARLRVGAVLEFGVPSSEALGRRQERVTVKLEASNGASVQVDYILALHAGRWQIINLFIDGVSELAVWRAEFSHILKTRGIDVLVRRLSGVVNDSKVGE